MTRLRTFLAIDPGQEIRDRCLAVQDSLARCGAEVKWVEPDNLHLTLLFLGEVNDRDVPAICNVVAETCATQARFTMAVEGVCCFGNPRRPRTIWVGLGAGHFKTIALHDAIEAPLLELGCYRREERAFTPHITLGRVRTERDSAALAKALERERNWKAGETQVSEVLVLSSELSRNGPTYTVLSRAAISG